MNRTVFAAAFLVLAAFSLSSVRAQGLDQISPWQGTPANGQVVGMSNTEVTVDVRGAERKFPVNEIRRITFTEDPAELRRARDNVLTGQYEFALLDLKKIDPASIERPEVKQDFEFYLAYAEGRQALSGGGDKSAAVTRMLGFVGSYRDSFHFFEAAELLGDLAVSLESYENAAKYYNAIAAKAPWPDYKMKASILEGRALIAQENYAEAQQRFAGVISQTVDTPQATRQKRLAEVGSAVCLAESGDHEQAIQTLEEIISKNDPQDQELFGRAYNALGRCHLKAGRTQEALLAYLHVDVLFYAEPEVHAEALYNLNKLWAAVKKADRAVSARTLLTDRYAGSVWAKKE